MRAPRSVSEPSVGLGAMLQSAPPGTALACLGVVVAFLFHALYGALLVDTAMAMCIAWAALLALALLSKWGRRELEQAPSLLWPGLCFGAVLVVGLWSMTPWVPGGPHPVWTYVGVPGGASIDPSSTIIEMIKLLGFACAFVFGVLVGGADDRTRIVLKLMVYGGAAASAVAFVLFVGGAEAESFGGRFAVLFQSANTAGTVFGTLLVLSIAAISSALRAGTGASGRDGPVTRAGVPAAAALVFLGCLLATASRGAVIATSVALLVQLGWDALTSSQKKTWFALGGAALTVIVVTAMFTVGEPLLERFLNVHQDSLARNTIFSAHWSAFLASPLNGYGLGSFDPLNHSIMTPQTFADLWSIRATHNVYIQWLEEAGLIGAIPMFLTIAVLMGATLIGARRRSRMKGWLHALVACDLIFLLHGASDFALQTPSVGAFWALLLGLQFAAAQASSGRP